MSSELELLRQRISELEAKNAKLEAEKAELLKQVMERDAKRDAENTELKSRVGELEARLAILEQDGKEVIAEVQSSIVNPVSAIDVSDTVVDMSDDAKLEQDSSVVDEQSQDAEDGKVFLLRGRFAGPEATKSGAFSKKGTSGDQSNNANTKLTEDDPVNAFLIEQHKKSIGEEIRQRNREKKLLHESANQEASSISQDIPVITTSQENNDDDIEFTKSQVIEQELTKELLSGIISAPSISFEATERIPSVSHPSSSLDTTQNLVHLFQNAIRAGHEVILSWLYYSNSFENKVDEIRHDTGASDKTARSQIYKEMLEHLPGITLGNLRMRTLRAKKIRMLFGEGGVGIDKIIQVTFSVYDISSLTINQIQSVIKNVTSAGRTPEVPKRNHVTSVTNRDDQINVSAEVTTTYDRSYFRNKTLDRYPALYREFSSENFDYYGITDETSCPLCKLNHNDEESIEGRYKSGSYFIKCEQREIEITA